MRFSLKYRQSTISYLRFGTGERCLICFHGFGDRAAIFHHLERQLGEKFTLIAIDLPFHGHTEWHEKTIQRVDFEQIVNSLLTIEGVERFSLAGFSFGSRIVQNLLFSHGDFIDHILLFAPDGFGTKGLKNATLFPIPLRRLLRFLLKKPDRLVKFVHWLFKKKLVTKDVHWFFSENIGNPQRRERFFFYWLALNDFERKPHFFKKKLQETGIKTHIFLGENDHITPLSIGTFLTTDAPNVQVHIVEGAHQVLGHLPPFTI